MLEQEATDLGMVLGVTVGLDFNEPRQLKPAKGKGTHHSPGQTRPGSICPLPVDSKGQ